MQHPTKTVADARPSTPCQQGSFQFQDLDGRKVVVDFTGGTLSSDGGALLLRQVDASLGLTRRLAECFGDQRDQRFVEHSMQQLLAQHIHGLALGYEDLNDHEHLRRDPVLATACGKADPLGLDRIDPADRGHPLAAAATLNRLELSNNKTTRCHKLPHDPAKVAACLLTLGVRCVPKHAKEVVIDLDSMGHLVHGLQEGRHYNDYYGDYCYLPLYIVVGEVVLWAQLRTSDKGGADGVVPALTQVVAAIRQRCKKARIVVRGDSGFCTDEIMAWCEAQPGVYYGLGLAKNPVLIGKLTPALVTARLRRCLCGAPSVREFAEFEYQTQKSWSRARLYEEFYCARGEMENVLKQQVLDLEADKLSTHFLASNQLRLWLASFAYLLVERLRAWGCHGTELARATVGTSA